MKKIFSHLVIVFASITFTYAMGPNTRKQLLEATQRNDINAVKQLLEDDDGLMTSTFFLHLPKDTDGNNPLMIAVKNNNTDLVKLFTDRNNNAANYENNKKQTALTVAITSNNLDILNLLLNSSEIYIDQQDLEKNTPLMHAVRTKNAGVVKAILGEVPNPDIENNDKKTALGIAQTIKDMPKDIVNLLESASVRDQYRLYEAIKDKEDLKEIERLITPQISFDIPSIRNPLVTAIHAQKLLQKLPIIKLLISKGAKVNTSLKQGFTPLLVALTQDLKKGVEIIKFLLEKGADVNVRSSIGLLPIHAAIMQNNPEIIELLVKHGADINVQEETNKATPLMLAAVEGKQKSVEKLLELGADPSLQNSQGNTALDGAATAKEFNEGEPIEAVYINIIELLKKAPIPPKKPAPAPTPEPAGPLISQLQNLNQKLRTLQRALGK